MSILRQKYNPILNELMKRIEQADKDWAMKGDDRALHEYNMLVQEVIEIKEAIWKSEKEES